VNDRRALVTGATGFIGSRLAPALRADGWKVHVIVRPASDAARVAALRDDGCEIHVHDGTHVGIEMIVDNSRPTCTWHLATKFVPQHRTDDVVPLVRGNVEFGTSLLDALARFGGAAAVVTAGTAWQQHDNTAYSPMSLYAATKQAFDVIAAYYSGVMQARIVECMLFDTYGPNDPRKKLLWALANAARSGEPLKLSGEGRQFVDFVHVDDAVRALLIAGARAMGAAPGTSERWAVRSPESLTVRDVVERFGRARGGEIPVEWNSRPGRLREMNVAWTAGEVLPGWSPSIPLDEGLASLG
jgi:nucleoside-diphosphate-sugar epimerase